MLCAMPNAAGSGLKPVQARAAALLGSGTTVADVARTLGIGTRTLRTWNRQPEFRLAVEAAAAAGVAALSSRLDSLAVKALDRLADLLVSEDERTAIAAVRTALDNAHRFHELHDLAERVAALEATHEGRDVE